MHTAVERMVEKSEGSVYKLVNLAAHRALEISEGQPKLVASRSEEKATEIALREIAEGKVVCKKKK